MFTRHSKNNLIYFTSPVLDSFGIPHFFASRHGGVSNGCFDSLNVSPARKDENGNTDSQENIAQNYAFALSILGVKPENACTTKQVHSVIIKKADKSDAGRGILGYKPVKEDCDGVFLKNGTENLSAVCAKTADCVPILLANTKNGDVCAVHAGWRGTVGDIVTRAVEAMGCAPCDVVAAIGPCIGSCCYEVGDEVYSAVKRLFDSKGIGKLTESMFASEIMCSISSKRYADLAKINATLLGKAGLKKQNIDISNLCTCCTYGGDGQLLFFSHRGMGGHSGTFVSAIKTFGEVKS